MIRSIKISGSTSFVGGIMAEVTMFACKPHPDGHGICIGISPDDYSKDAVIALGVQAGDQAKWVAKLTPEQALTIAGELVKHAKNAALIAAEIAMLAAGAGGAE